MEVVISDCAVMRTQAGPQSTFSGTPQRQPWKLSDPFQRACMYTEYFLESLSYFRLIELHTMVGEFYKVEQKVHLMCVCVCSKTNSKWCRGTTTSNFWALRIKTFLSTLRILLHFFLPCFCVARDVFMYQSTSQGLRRMHNSYFATKLQSSLSVTALGSLFKIRWI